MGGKRAGDKRSSGRKSSRIAKKAAHVVSELVPPQGSRSSRIAVRPSSAPPARGKKRGGFAAMTPERLKEVSRKGGNKAAENLGKNRGFALLAPEERRELAQKGQEAVRARGTAYQFDEDAARAARAIGAQRFSSLPVNWQAAAKVARGFNRLATVLQVDVSTLYRIARGLYQPRNSLQLLINQWFDKHEIALPFPDLAAETKRYASA